MAGDEWEPLSIREGFRDRGDFDVLHERVPEWLIASLQDWFEDYYEGAPDYYDMDRVIRYAERTLRRRLGDDWSAATHPKNPDEDLLDLVDFLLGYAIKQFTQVLTDPEGNTYTTGEDMASRLESILEDAGSAWMVDVTDTDARLVRRLAPEVVEAAKLAIAQEDRAAIHLREAWTDVFGRAPDPSDGYRQAVKAVEAVAQPVISPEDTTATLGKMIAAVRSKPEKWQVDLQHFDPAKQVEQVVGMMELLWKGQHDRHGTSDDDAPFNVSQPEAEAAMHLAITLVQWFRSGVIRMSTVQ